MQVFQWLLQYYHREERCSCGNVAGALGNAVGRYHSGSCISFRCTQRNSSFQIARFIQKSCSLFRQDSGCLSCHQHFWQNLSNLPRIILICHEMIELLNHLFVIISGCHINREHTGSIANSQHFLSRHLPVNVSCKCRHIGNVLYMICIIQDCLIQMCDTPSQRNIILEQINQNLCCCTCITIPPGCKWRQQISLLIKCHISVHHRAEADCSKLFNHNSIFFLHILCQISVAISQTCPDIIERIRPDTIFETIFPTVTSRCDWIVILIDQYGLNPRRAKFNSKKCSSALDQLLYITHVH